MPSRWHPRPAGKCRLCGKPIWSRRELAPLPDGGYRHADCPERPNRVSPVESMAAAGYMPGRLIGTVDGRFHTDGETRRYAERAGVIYVRTGADRTWRIDQALTDYRREALSELPYAKATSTKGDGRE